MTHAHRNIRAWYERATSDERFAGFAWYPTANATAQAIAAESGVSVQCAAGVIAALSPQNVWERNARDARALILAVTNGEPVPACATFSANVRKAERIAQGENPLDVLSGDKVTTFYRNILGDTDGVTVDRWAIRAATNGKRDKVNGTAEYARLARAYRQVAAEYGITPRDLQAVVWVVIRDRF